LSQLSQFHCLLLHRLAAAFDLYVYHFNVCTEFWEDMTTTAEDRWRAVRAAGTVDVAEEGEELDLDIENPLLKSWGKAGRETVKLLADLEESEHALTPVWLDLPDEEPRTVLRAVQQLVSRRTSRLDQRLCQDRSLQMAGCPGILREIETVHDSIIGNLLDPEHGHAAGLRLTDIAVLVPDMASYKPVIGQVFDGRGGVPYNLVDSSAAEDSVYGRALLGLLDLAVGDFSRKQVFELLLNPCFMAAAGVDRDEVSVWLDLAEELGVFHDLDAEQRVARGLPASWRFTWEQALRRLRLGLTLDPGETVPETSPFAEFPAAVPPFLGEEPAARLSTVVRRLGTALRGLDQRRESCAGWRDLFLQLMESFLDIPDDLPGEQQVRKALVRALDSLVGGEAQLGLSSCLAAAEAEEEFGLSLVREYLAEALGSISSGRGRYLVGGVTVASFLPMRPIPFKVVYIVGLQEGGFPGRADRSTLDLRLVRRRLGDVGRPDANRYLFLENLMAVRERLYLTYVNRDLAKDEEFYPCSVLKQLAEFIEARVLPEGEEFLETNIPLRPSDWTCVSPAAESWTDLGRTWSASHRLLGIIERAKGLPEWVEPLLAALRERVGSSPEAPEAFLFRQALAALGGGETPADAGLAVPVAGTVPVDVSELERLLRDPAAATLRRHLGLREAEANEALLAEDEPVVLSMLTRYGYTREAMAEYLATGDRDAAVAHLQDRLGEAQRQSLAPVGTFADLQADSLAHVLDERLGEEDPFSSLRGRELWRELVFGGAARGDLPPARHVPEVIVTGIPVGERRVDVALSGRVEFFCPARDGVATMVVVTDSALHAARFEDKSHAPGYQVLGPLLAWCALRGAGVDLDLGEALDVQVAYRGTRKSMALHTWRFEMTPPEGMAWLRSLLASLLSGTACELLPYAVLVNDAELVEAVRVPENGPLAALPDRIRDRIEAEQERQHSPYRPPEFLAAVDDLAVPEDAWEKLLARLAPVWRGREV
jgi:hypothetical protein